MRKHLLAFAFLAACDGTAWNTTVADTAITRMQMLNSIEFGRTTAAEFERRWGQPTQKMREGARMTYVYRNMGKLGEAIEAPLMFGDSANYFMVTFDYGIAIAFESPETVHCRATFPPRPPGPGFNNPSVIRPVGSCAPPDPIVSAQDVSGGQGGPEGGEVPSDDYIPGTGALK